MNHDTGTILEAIVLGSGGSPGVPMPGCDCGVCRSTDPRNNRTRCSLLIRYRGRNLLIDTTTDLRQQVLREGIDRIDAVLYTHGHADHVHGIDDLRPFNRWRQEPIPVYASETTIRHLHRVFPYIFADPAPEGYRPRLSSHILTGPTDILGLRIVPVPLIHGAGEATGYRIGPLAYLTDCSAIPESSWPLLEGIEVLILDGLRLRPHPTHFHLAKAVEAGRRIGAGKTYLTHLNHEIDHPRHQPELPAGFFLAHDGLRIFLEYSLSEEST
ncbi:phosphoribosyl 1,2-cyclic phosphate phosphodiesterase [Geothermobacter ehrlichii]|uniref:Phosphoribosyl 1,2-cyclic phosphate phosphodiesterase n=1 Tax=Geothermobacter ehrlichii TaxID=213224 RepID=A0A5D3WIP1_9BACT|nr:GPMC system MBL fold metallohydrolase [Geothermobacter ehrlichii]TYO98102.1 phosphoribosyl 1,2-cyclic phosphate phosphodiesterase [Geothermobacter ehrlichii]